MLDRIPKQLGANIYDLTPADEDRLFRDQLRLAGIGGLDPGSGWTFSEHRHPTFTLLVVYQHYVRDGDRVVPEKPDLWRNLLQHLKLDSDKHA